jgi:bidirectional [NiFe] hydrogenase diaphorase subunit
VKSIEKPPPEIPPDDPRYRPVDLALKRHQYRPDALVEVLNLAQETFGCLDDDLLAYVARALGLPPSHVCGVATFYHFYTREPAGAHRCVVCTGTACHVKRADEIVGAVEGAFGVKPGRTTDDGKLTLSVARCLGNCSMAPLLVVDGETVAHGTPGSAVARLRAAIDGESPE